MSGWQTSLSQWLFYLVQPCWFWNTLSLWFCGELFAKVVHNLQCTLWILSLCNWFYTFLLSEYLINFRIGSLPLFEGGVGFMLMSAVGAYERYNSEKPVLFVLPVQQVRAEKQTDCAASLKHYCPGPRPQWGNMECDLHYNCGKAQFTNRPFKTMIFRSICTFVKDENKSP